MKPMEAILSPASLLIENADLFVQNDLPGPILDLACGEGHNGIFLAGRGLQVICCDISLETLRRGRNLAKRLGVNVEFRQRNLEVRGVNPLEENYYGGIMVFRYLHRPLIPCIKKSIRNGGILIYETFTAEQHRYGKPHNPDYLLKSGELRGWFANWEVLHYFEGIKESPKRAIAQLISRKP